MLDDGFCCIMRPRHTQKPPRSSHLSAASSTVFYQPPAHRSAVIKVMEAPHDLSKQIRHDACCRAYDLPFQRHMGLPYSDFVLNIQPDDYQQLNDKIQFFLDNPARLRHMQVITDIARFMNACLRRTREGQTSDQPGVAGRDVI